MPFPLFTSIKPPATDWVLSCLASWRAAGFEPVTVDGPNGGKPRIGAILEAIRKSGEPFAGIINSDCRMIAYPDLASNLRASLERTIRVAWRIDIGDGKPVACLGFDGFFFDTAILPDNDAGFTIGGSWWDYWFPIACEAAGAWIERISAPIMTHKVHPLNYSEQDMMDGYRLFWRATMEWHQQETFSPSEMGEMSTKVRAWIHRRPAGNILLSSGMSEIEAVLHLGGDAMLADAETQHLRGEIAALRNSTSWRITAPLRRMVVAARSIAAFQI